MITTFTPETNGIADMPEEISNAICVVQENLHGSVKKTGKNTHGGYMFASTDDIYGAVTKLMGANKLVCMCLESKCEIVRTEKDGKTVQWAHIVFQFVLSAKGKTWTDPALKRTVFVQITGPQTFQAAQSFAEKAFLRSLFKIPTGDVDLDAMPQADTEDGQVDLVQPRKKKSSHAAKKDGTTTATFDQIRREIADAKTLEQVQEVRDRYAQEWAEMPAKWEEILNHEHEDRLIGFGVFNERGAA